MGSVAPGFDPDTAELARKVIILLAAALPATVATIAFSACCNVSGRFGAPASIRQIPRAAVALALLLGGGSVLALQAAAAFSAAYLLVALLTGLLAWLGAASDPAAARGQTQPAPDGAATLLRRRGLAALVLTVSALAAIWMETGFAARMGQGAVAALDFGQRLGALCGNTLATALGLVAFTEMARQAAAGHAATLGRRFWQAMLVGLALLVPVQVYVAVNAAAIVDLVLGHGKMTEEGAAQITALLRIMAFAPLGAFILRMLMVRLLVAEALPMLRLTLVASMLDLLARLILFIVLTPRLGLLGIPVALAIAPLAPILYLGLALSRRNCLDGRISRPVMILPALACLLAALVIAMGSAAAPIIADPVHGALGGALRSGSIVQLAVSGLAGAAVMLTAVRVLGLKRMLKGGA
ncbi:Peptidoglycan biosynthesis protein MviN/MurJ, putative lipid II flippase [Paracoccus isoporae]|uniref:Peptidoglycan biosynthesis protein MviN/MurJ, putative lipid II flippase n=1 Tax=Paracoccus isoporae TaxID=591205 RepID=A0A1G6XIK4_9RHOB|nr:lipid II flippase MurJ [Paracoccus isoporae]SDD77137.1 Peptidoglycan biosynthesis protein MviN/MurJ, putative lipid II flippase [Paracoccus isoporae]